MAKKILTFGFLLLFASYSYGQQNKLIRGLVLNEEKTAMPFTNIYNINGKQHTITNENGEFVIYVQPTDTILIISYLGYINDTISIFEPTDYYNISLSPLVYSINEAIIENNTPKSLIKKAIKSIPKNYPQHNITTEGFYKEKLDVNTNSYSFTEAYLAIKKNYKQNSTEKTFLLKNRSFILSTSDSIKIDMVYSGDNDIIKSYKSFFNETFFSNNEFFF